MMQQETNWQAAARKIQITKEIRGMIRAIAGSFGPDAFDYLEPDDQYEMRLVGGCLILNLPLLQKEYDRLCAIYKNPKYQERILLNILSR